MKIANTRRFEIPYNFDIDLIKGLQLLKVTLNEIDCFYVCPFFDDYKTVARNRESQWEKDIDREEYIRQIKYIESVYPGRLQLLLQKRNPDEVLNKEQLQFYFDLGFKNFCCGSYEQARILREIDPEFTIVGSIVMHITPKDLYEHPEYHGVFNSFVLDFSYTKDIQNIKMLPTYYNYILLTNSLCNCKCDGTHHWELKPNELNHCFGLINSVGFEKSCLIRPMDLKYFDPYISVYKLQDRGWPTSWILRDVVLYSTDYTFYPGIVYDEDLYEQNSYKKW